MRLRKAHFHVCMFCSNLLVAASAMRPQSSLFSLMPSSIMAMVSFKGGDLWQGCRLPALELGFKRGPKREQSSWAAYQLNKTILDQHPGDAKLQLETAEALLRWIRRATNGNFPTAAAGQMSKGDSVSSRNIWRKHAPEAVKLLRAASSYAMSGAYDIAKYKFLRAEASTYLSSAKGVVRAAAQADVVNFKTNVKPLLTEHEQYQSGVGHTFMGAFHLAAPWPMHNLTKAQAHFDAAVKIDPRSRRNQYCQGLVALAKGDMQKAKASFRQAVRCTPRSPEEDDISEFFLRESKGALRALERQPRGAGGDHQGRTS